MRLDDPTLDYSKIRPIRGKKWMAAVADDRPYDVDGAPTGPIDRLKLEDGNWYDISLLEACPK